MCVDHTMRTEVLKNVEGTVEEKLKYVEGTIQVRTLVFLCVPPPLSHWRDYATAVACTRPRLRWALISFAIPPLRMHATERDGPPGGGAGDQHPPHGE